MAALGLGFLMLPSTATRAAEAPTIPPDCELVESLTLQISEISDAENLVLSDGSELNLNVLTSDLDDPVVLRTQKGLVGKTLTILQTKNSDHHPDRYGRLSGQAMVHDNEKRTWLQARLISQGIAQTRIERTPSTCLTALLQLEATARQNKKGHWGTRLFEVLPASKPKLLLKEAHSYSIVEGTITRRSKSRGRVYLNFGKDWKQDFTVRIPARLVKNNQIGARLSKGTKVRVRGWIRSKNGPLMDVQNLDALEFLD
ncbi:MAG: thermonuclease family protein [Filomicrobium sp.]